MKPTAVDQRSIAGPSALRDWLAVGSVALGTFVMVTSEFLPIGLLEPIAQALRISPGQAGLMVTVPGMAAAIAAPAVAIAAGSSDRRRLLIALTALIIVADAVVAGGSSLPLVLIGRALLGLAVGGFWAFAAAVGRRLVQEQDGNRATALILGGISLGTVLGVPIGTSIGTLAGWRTAFALVAGFGVVVLVGQALLLPTLPSHQRLSFRNVVVVARIPRIRVGFAAAALLAAGHFAAYTYLSPFLTLISHLPGSSLSWTLAGYGTAGVVGTWVGERAASWNAQRAYAANAALIGAAILLAILLNQSRFATIASVTMWGAAFGAMPVCLQVWTYQAAPEALEAASALMVTVFQVALATGAWLGGQIVDRIGIVAAFIIASNLSVAAALVILILGSMSRLQNIRE